MTCPRHNVCGTCSHWVRSTPHPTLGWCTHLRTPVRLSRRDFGLLRFWGATCEYYLDLMTARQRKVDASIEKAERRKEPA